MNEIVNVIKVGIADMNVVQVPYLIRTSGLGSCVGVVVFDLMKGVAGLAHVMLPSSSLARSESLNVAKYADTAIEALISLVVKAGGRKSALKAKMAGGAQMFQFHSANTDMMRIGPRNVEAVKQQLQRFHIPIVAEDVGGNSGRTIEFNPQTGLLFIRTVNQGVKEI
ncbi:cheD chemotactic sensory transduction family protein [Anoxybacillus sp. B7M1]|jgi:chemotaxis protein CheD|uniref:Probable chemoreceptor glutamine deamidase CheD n=1 Tax=Anoxybacteroides rupiense TaxID=311460 RepID=A0ABT5W4D4_9BACL|nr:MULTISPECIES: chemotaxis protein CheD [Anoxybacillus]ANB56168.1 cheD chemotactic sensory transduction family protein [Anoxybacillus sp. B2M1]ANB63267.1 cheD chemotactic sensory transduction family protein [Anoxybacillus sp. B7M1]KXG10572.1 Chemoreceptor glutamine deamidase CheD [Anoxybacillus sp. P3H1B]MBB3906144.1 chemotaxis protein CheD [Anoxybacillus rupiensis]MBS2771031.1 chemotaxis protein CheD [Anoxybacillus rupiensis]